MNRWEPPSFVSESVTTHMAAILVTQHLTGITSFHHFYQSKVFLRSTMAYLLYVEDDENLSFITKENLEMAGHEVDHYLNGADALRAFAPHKYGLAILDVMLPELDGFELAKRIRKQDQHIPILFLTARSLKEDRIAGLKIGADDYLTKPFSLEELMLRIQVFLRRSQVLTDAEKPASDGLLPIGPMVLDVPNLTLRTEEGDSVLTQREAAVLAYLAIRPNQVVRREEILKELWGDDDYFMGRSLDVFISRLRKYLAQAANVQIDTLHSVGFRLTIKS